MVCVESVSGIRMRLWMEAELGDICTAFRYDCDDESIQVIIVHPPCLMQVETAEEVRARGQQVLRIIHFILDDHLDCIMKGQFSQETFRIDAQRALQDQYAVEFKY